MRFGRTPTGAAVGPRLIVVAGKGGTGRTTVSAALGLALARSGRRTCVVELHGQDALARRLGVPHAYGPTPVVPGLDHRGLTAVRAVGDFSRRKIGLPGITRFVVESRVTASFLDAVPGLSDIVQMGKIENMIREPRPGEPVYDHVILDAPATGHGLSLIAGARAMYRMTRVGPFADLAHIIEDFLGDPAHTAHLLLALPAELPIQEAIELHDRLVDDATAPAVALVNQVPIAPPPGVEPAAIRARADHLPGEAGAQVAAIVSAALDASARASGHLATLRQQVGNVPVHSLPRLDDPDDLTPLVEALADVLGIREAP